jgi:hypothetical protein
MLMDKKGIAALGFGFVNQPIQRYEIYGRLRGGRPGEQQSEYE